MHESNFGRKHMYYKFFLSRFRDFFLTNYVFLRGNMREERKRERERKTKENIINKQNPL